MHFYLIKRGPRPSYHLAPYHPVIITNRKYIAKWQAGSSSDKAFVWAGDAEGGWLLFRWNGLDIDYGHIVHRVTLPDGTDAGFEHDRKKEPWTLLSGAIWWSVKPVPPILAKLGVVVAPDDFTLKTIAEDFADGRVYRP